MNQLVPFTDRAPALIAAGGASASYRFFEFFTANIRNPHTRRAYARAAVEFFDWLEARGVTRLTAIESVHVAAHIEQLQKARSAPTAKLRLAALRHLFDWLVVGQIMPVNPAAAVAVDVSALFSAEFGAVHSYYATLIAAARQSLSPRDIAAAVRSLLNQKCAAMRALTERSQAASRAQRESKVAPERPAAGRVATGGRQPS